MSSSELSKDIVIINRYSSKFHSQQGGGGKTPGNFIVGYTSRLDATEQYIISDKVIDDRNFAFLQDIRNFVGDIRKTSSEVVDLSKRDGRSFGNLSLDYSDERLNNQAKKIQELYDDGHSVLKTVISFSDKYLKENDLIDENNKGNLFNSVDNMKMRKAFTEAMNKMNDVGDFTNPEWIASFQYDRNALHAHLVIADDVDLRSSKRKVPSARQNSDDGVGKHIEDRGKILEPEKKEFRKSFDEEINNMKSLETFHDLNKMNEISLQSHLNNNLLKKEHMKQLLSKAVMAPGVEKQAAIESYSNNLQEINGLDPRKNRNRSELIHQNIRDKFSNIKVANNKYVNKPNLISKYQERLNEHLTAATLSQEQLYNYDEKNNQHLVSDSAKVMRPFYKQQLLSNAALVDKYRFLLNNNSENKLFKTENSDNLTMLDKRETLIDYGKENGCFVQANESLINKTLNDSKLQKILDKKVEGKTISTTLEEISNGQNKDALNFQIQYILNYVGEKDKSYENLGDRIVIELLEHNTTDLNVENNEYYENVYFKKLNEDYINELSDYRYQQFLKGEITSDRLIDYEEVKERFEETRDINDIPNANKIENYALNDEAHFKTTKFLDINQIKNDLKPNEAILVDEKLVSDYIDDKELQLETAQSAQGYQLITEQSHTQIDSLIEDLNYEIYYGQLLATEKEFMLEDENESEEEFDLATENSDELIDENEVNKFNQQNAEMMREILMNYDEGYNEFEEIDI